MRIIDGRTYYLQQDIVALVNRSPPKVAKMIFTGEIEAPVATVGMSNLWNEAQYKRIAKKFRVEEVA